MVTPPAAPSASSAPSAAPAASAAAPVSSPASPAAASAPLTLNSVSVALPDQQFYGPIQLLVEIIGQGQIDIADVSLSEVVDAYLDALKEMPLDHLTDFITVAASLLLLKSRALLPEDDQDGLLDDLYRWEERDILLARLIECRTFRQASRHMHSRMESAARSVPRRAFLEERFWNLYPDPLVDVSLDDLLAAFLESVRSQPAPMVDIAHLAPIRFKVSDALEHLFEEMPRRKTVLFCDIERRFPGRTGFVVYFLAVLELWRQGYVELSQLRTFGDIEMLWSGGDMDTSELHEANKGDTYD